MAEGLGEHPAKDASSAAKPDRPCLRQVHKTLCRVQKASAGGFEVTLRRQLQDWAKRSYEMFSMLLSGGWGVVPCLRRAGEDVAGSAWRQGASSPHGDVQPADMFEGPSASRNGESPPPSGSTRIGVCPPPAHRDALQPPSWSGCVVPSRGTA